MIELTARQLAQAFQKLDAMARDEFHEPLSSLASSDANNQDQILRVGRLIGVILKEPFATPHVHSAPSEITRAYRSWELNSLEQFNAQTKTWQYRALAQIQSELRNESIYVPDSPYEFARDAQHERGFFGFLALSIRKYICGDPALKKKIREQVAAAKKGGVSVDLKDPATLVAGGGFALGAYLISVVPVLGYVGAPVIAGIVLLFYTVGVDAFCEWSKQWAEGNAHRETH
jgi:hypothetical protein